MWMIIQGLLPALLAILVVSQYILPLLMNKPTWWLFKKKETEAEAARVA